MSAKRPISDRPDEDVEEDDREVKRQKIIPHQSKLETVLKEFLDCVTPASPKSLSDFNEKEQAENRRGVPPIDIILLKMELKDLQVAKDTETLDAGLNRIGSNLENLQKVYDNYITEVVAKADEVKVQVRPALSDVILGIQRARKKLSGIFPHCLSCFGKLNVTIHRH
jgi:hypothetical protein